MWSLIWIALALLFGVAVYSFMGRDAGLEYFTGELAESGSPTWLSGRDTGSIPRRVLGAMCTTGLWWTVMNAHPSTRERVAG